MIEIEKPNIATVNLSEDGKSGKFIIEPLERGYGLPVTGSALILPGVLALAVRLGLAMAMPGLAALCLMAVGFLTPFPLKKPQAAGKAALLLCGGAVLALVAGVLL